MLLRITLNKVLKPSVLSQAYAFQEKKIGPMNIQDLTSSVYTRFQQNGTAPSPLTNLALAIVIQTLRKNKKEEKREAMVPLFLEAESKLEKEWGRKISEGAQIEEYPYYQEHKELIVNEIKEIESEYCKKRIAIIGAGALPLTALALKAIGAQKITCIDKDKEAIEQGKRVIGKITKEQIEYVQADMKEMNDDYDLYIITGGVNTEDKTESIKIFLKKIKKEKKVFVRAGRKGGKLLYPAIDEAKIKAYILKKVNHPLMQTYILQGEKNGE